MKRLVFGMVLALLCATVAVADPINMTILPSVAPNAFGSPSWGAYAANAMTGLQSGGPAGTPGTPSYYAAGGPFLPGDFIVTTFNSWRGELAPPAPFDNEYGNRVHFGLHIASDASLFSLSELSFSMTSSNPLHILDWSSGFDSTDNYSALRLGINYGADGIKGTADDFLITSGSASQLVNELFYIGIANSMWPGLTGDPSNPLGPDDVLNPAHLAADLNYINSTDFSVTTTYTLTDSTGTVLAQNSATVAPIPEPGSMMLLGTGLIGVASMLQRKLRR